MAVSGSHQFATGMATGYRRGGFVKRGKKGRGFKQPKGFKPKAPQQQPQPSPDDTDQDAASLSPAVPSAPGPSVGGGVPMGVPPSPTGAQDIDRDQDTDTAGYARGGMVKRYQEGGAVADLSNFQGIVDASRMVDPNAFARNIAQSPRSQNVEDYRAGGGDASAVGGALSRLDSNLRDLGSNIYKTATGDPYDPNSMQGQLGYGNIPGSTWRDIVRQATGFANGGMVRGYQFGGPVTDEDNQSDLYPTAAPAQDVAFSPPPPEEDTERRGDRERLERLTGTEGGPAVPTGDEQSYSGQLGFTVPSGFGRASGADITLYQGQPSDAEHRRNALQAAWDSFLDPNHPSGVEGMLRGDGAMPHDEMSARLKALSDANPDMNHNDLLHEAMLDAWRNGDWGATTGILQNLRQTHDGLRTIANAALDNNDPQGAAAAATAAHNHVPDGNKTTVTAQPDGSYQFHIRGTDGQASIYNLSPAQMWQYAHGLAGQFDHVLGNGIHKNLDTLTRQQAPLQTGYQPQFQPPTGPGTVSYATPSGVKLGIPLVRDQAGNLVGARTGAGAAQQVLPEFRQGGFRQDNYLSDEELRAPLSGGAQRVPSYAHVPTGWNSIPAEDPTLGRIAIPPGQAPGFKDVTKYLADGTPIQMRVPNAWNPANIRYEHPTGGLPGERDEPVYDRPPTQTAQTAEGQAAPPLVAGTSSVQRPAGQYGGLGAQPGQQAPWQPTYVGAGRQPPPEDQSPEAQASRLYPAASQTGQRAQATMQIMKDQQKAAVDLAKAAQRSGKADGASQSSMFNLLNQTEKNYQTALKDGLENPEQYRLPEESRNYIKSLVQQRAAPTAPAAPAPAAAPVRTAGQLPLTGWSRDADGYWINSAFPGQRRNDRGQLVQ